LPGAASFAGVEAMEAGSNIGREESSFMRTTKHHDFGVKSIN
jgi:hypothetical protein